MHDDAADGGKAAYKALQTGGSSGFNALLGGNRTQNGEYARLEAHGFYWTATEKRFRNRALLQLRPRIAEWPYSLRRQTMGSSFAARRAGP